MKTIAAGAAMTLVCALWALPAGAQQGPPAGGPGRGRMGAPRAYAGARIEAALARRAELELTDEQVTRLEDLLQGVRADRDTAVQRMRALRDEAAGDRAALREAMMELREELRTQAAERDRVRDILTDEQLRELGPAGPRGPRGEGGAWLRPRGGRGGGGGAGLLAGPRRGAGPCRPGGGAARRGPGPGRPGPGR